MDEDVNLVVRLPEALRRDSRAAAGTRKMSLRAWVEAALQEHLQRCGSRPLEEEVADG